MSGNQNGTVSIWDLTSAPVSQLNSDPVLPATYTFIAHDKDTVNGLRFVTITVYFFSFSMQLTVLHCCIIMQFLPHNAVQSTAYAVMHCLSVCLSITLMYSVETSKYIFNFFSLSDNHTILVYLYQTLWQYSDRDGSFL